MKKRILSALLSVCMLLTLFLTPALAADGAQTGQDQEKQPVLMDEAPIVKAEEIGRAHV